MHQMIADHWRNIRSSLRSLSRSIGKSSVIYLRVGHLAKNCPKRFEREATNHAEKDGGDEIRL